MAIHKNLKNREIIAKENLHSIVIFVVVFLVYSNTILNDFVLDDAIVYSENSFVAAGFNGIKEIIMNDSFTGFFNENKELINGGRYRPLSLFTFAIEYSIWDLKPGISHLINVLLYSLLCIAIYRFLSLFLAELKLKNKVFVALIATLIFALHPIHTEVVANIKGRDEILAFLFGLLSINIILKNIKNVQIHPYLLSATFLFLALLSKENAFTFPFILIAIIFLLHLQDTTRVLKFPFTRSLILIVPVCIYFVIRHKIVGGILDGGSGELLNNPFLNATEIQHFSTVVTPYFVICNC